jgi:hypothetical protein
MALVSRNYFWLRLFAFCFNFILSGAVAITLGILFDATPAYMLISALAVSSFLGSWNVLEPKAVEQELEKIARILDGVDKIK